MRFPSTEFFLELGRRAAGDARLSRLGVFDVTFGVRVLPGGPVEATRLFVLGFDTGASVAVREASGDAFPEGVDFVLEAPYPVWREMLAARGTGGEIDAAHTLNTLTHWDRPMRAEARDPLGHDKLFRYQESLQQVMNLAAAVAVEADAG